MWDTCAPDGVPSFQCVEVLFVIIIQAIAGLVFIILLGMFILGSFSWLTAGDNAEKLKKAQGTFFSAILGLVIIVSAYLIINIIGNFFGLPDLGIITIPE